MKWWSQKKRALKAAQKGEAPVAKKRKVPWEEDGTLTVLLDWLTTEGNYAHYCGSSGNGGKSKAPYQKDIAALLKSKIPASEMDSKDIENRINSLE